MNTRKTRFFLFWSLVLFLFWISLSGKFDPFHLISGIIGAPLAAYLSVYVFRVDSLGRLEEGRQPRLRVNLPRFLFYPLWLGKEIAIANFRVARLALHPKLPLSPEILRIRESLPNAFAYTTLANSITLTPGTTTIDIESGELIVHAITKEDANHLRTSTPENVRGHVRGMFGVRQS